MQLKGVSQNIDKFRNTVDASGWIMNKVINQSMNNSNRPSIRQRKQVNQYKNQINTQLKHFFQSYSHFDRNSHFKLHSSHYKPSQSHRPTHHYNLSQSPPTEYQKSVLSQSYYQNGPKSRKCKKGMSRMGLNSQNYSILKQMSMYRQTMNKLRKHRKYPKYIDNIKSPLKQNTSQKNTGNGIANHKLRNRRPNERLKKCEQQVIRSNKSKLYRRELLDQICNYIVDIQQ